MSTRPQSLSERATPAARSSRAASQRATVRAAPCATDGASASALSRTTDTTGTRKGAQNLSSSAGA